MAKKDSIYAPRYKANKEWKKDIKFNGKWFHLKSIFDSDQLNFNVDYSKKDDLNFNVDLHDNDISDLVQPLNGLNFNANLNDAATSDIDQNEELIEVRKTEFDNTIPEHIGIIQELNDIFNGEEPCRPNIEITINYLLDDSLINNEPIELNKNIVGHTLEDYVFNYLKLSIQYSNITNISGNNHHKGRGKLEEPINIEEWVLTDPELGSSETYDIAVRYNDLTYYLEVKSGEDTRMRDSSLLTLSNVRLHDNQWEVKDKMIFVVLNYKLNKSKTSVKVTNIEIIDGSNLERN